MIRDFEIDDASIKTLLDADPIERNVQLMTFIGLLNSINKNTLLTIDGQWGSGKTIFVKQIEYLNRHCSGGVSGLEDNTVSEFQNKYITYYYNAWKNDFHGDPLQSILFNLINDLWGTRELVANTTLKVSTAFINSALKTASAGLYDAEEFRKAGSIKDLAKSITTANERKQAIDDIFYNHINLKGKKILIIIDELDRCHPVFAVKLLETLKHFYDNDNIVFLLSTNNVQLSHTIKKVYGESFDGVGYLNKFYDLIFNLPSVDSEKYIQYLGVNTRGRYWKDIIPLDVAKFLDLSMREMNRYHSSLKLIDSYMSSTGSFEDREIASQIVKYILIPLAYGLRIKNLAQYEDFVNGRGSEVLRDFCNQSDLPSSLITKNPVSEVADPSTSIVNMYVKMYTISYQSNREDYRVIEAAEIFKRVVLLMNSSGKIDSDEPDSDK